MRFLKRTFKFLVLLFILIIVALPYAVKYGAIHYLETEQNITTNIYDISINLFTGKISIEGLHLYGEQVGALHLGEFMVDMSLTEIFKKNILVESILITDFTSNVSELENAWNVGGITIPLGAEQEKEPEKEQEASKAFDWGYGVQSISFLNVNVDVSSQYTDSSFSIIKLEVDNVLSWHPGRTSLLALDMNINGDTFHIIGDASPFVDEPLIKTRVKINDIQLRPFLKSVKDLPFNEVNVALFSDFELEIASRADRIQLGINGDYGLRDIYLSDDAREIKLGKLMWNGEQTVTLPKKGAKMISLDGSVFLKNIDIIDSINNARVLQNEVALVGTYDIKLDEESEKPGVAASAALTIGELNIDTLDDKIKLAAFDNWVINTIKVNSIDDVVINTSEINNLVVLKDIGNKKLPAVAGLEKFIINDIKYQPNMVEIEKIELRHLNADVRLDKQGNIPALSTAYPKKPEPESNANDKLEAKTVTQEAPTTESEPEKEKIALVVNKILINSNSNIRFIDNSVTPVFDTKLHDLTLSITDINSSKPDKPAHIDFKANIDEYGKFSLKGNAHPFTEKVNAKLVADLDSLELVPLSSYAGKFAGINIKRGTLDLDADINAKDDILDVKNIFHMNQLNVESDESEVADNIFKDMPMPLDLTLDVLRDKNNIITLEIPVTGNINDPDFSLQDVYNTAMVKAMKYAATHYLMQAVQPLGLILTAGELIGKATAPKFDPLIFKEGSSEISDTNKKHIKNLAKILQEKDKLRFTICGTATESDWKAIQASKTETNAEKTADTKEVDTEKTAKTEPGKDTKVENNRTQILLKLANERTKLVKKEFVDTHKIDPKRLFSCNGKITKDKEDKIASPAVEITL